MTESEGEWDREGRRWRESVGRGGRAASGEGGKETFIRWKRMNGNNYGKFVELLASSKKH